MPSRPAIATCLLGALFMGACETWRIEPLPPDQRGPQVNTPPAPPAPPDQTPAPGPGESIVLLVDVIDCPVCAEMLAGRLGAAPGVARARVVAGSDRVFITPESGAAVAPAQLGRIATDAGFVYRGVAPAP